MKLTLDERRVARILLSHLTLRDKKLPPGVDCYVIFRHRDDGVFEAEVLTGDDLPPQRVEGVIYLSDFRS
ncbi:MAG TPA: hypothetical protein VIY27_13795 [Myxococcota bacterium]